MLFMIIREHGLDGSVFIVENLGKLYVSTMIDTLGDLAVMVEEIPFSVIFDDRMVCGPADNGFKYAALIGKRSHR